MGFWQGQSWLARLSLSCKCLPYWVPVKRGGLSTGHSCFPFLLNHTAAIWTRLSPHHATELLRCPDWASPDRPGPQSPGPCLVLQRLILSASALCCTSEGRLNFSGPGHGTCRHAGVCVCMCKEGLLIRTHPFVCVILLQVVH